MSDRHARKVFNGLSILLLVLSIGLGISNALATDDVWVIQTLGRFGAVIVGILPASVILAGLLVRGRLPLPGDLLILAGALVFAIMMAWTVVLPVVALLMLWLWLSTLKARRSGNPVP